MAVSSGFATTLAGAKMETLLLISTSSSSSSSGSSSSLRAHLASPPQVRVCGRPARNNYGRILMQRGGVRCEVAASTDSVVETDSNIDPAKVSSLSALEQLKTSAADSESKIFHFDFVFL